MHVLEIGPIQNNPQSIYTLVFGANVSVAKILASLVESAKMREELGLTTEEITIETVKQAETKLKALHTLRKV